MIDTLLGAAIGISAAVLFSTVLDRQELAHRHASRAREQFILVLGGAQQRKVEGPQTPGGFNRSSQHL
ncbi:MAG TPA: hypothetical protein VL147_19170 [Devosia sp.]|nr:hypothetical protein [Devosia sp.]